MAVLRHQGIVPLVLSLPKEMLDRILQEWSQALFCQASGYRTMALWHQPPIPALHLRQPPMKVLSCCQDNRKTDGGIHRFNVRLGGCWGQPAKDLWMWCLSTLLAEHLTTLQRISIHERQWDQQNGSWSSSRWQRGWVQLRPISL